MKNIGRLCIRYLLMYGAITAILLAISLLIGQTAAAQAQGGAFEYPQFFKDAPIAVLPLSALLTGLICLFPATRMFYRRSSGYLCLSLLNSLGLAIPVLLIRLWQPDYDFQTRASTIQPLLHLLPDYQAILLWAQGSVASDWSWLALYLLPPAAALAALWPFSRLTRHRPLFGVFLAPLALLGLLRLLRILMAGVGQLLFASLGIDLLPALSAMLLLSAILPAIYVFDGLFAFRPLGKPSGRKAHA